MSVPNSRIDPDGEVVSLSSAEFNVRQLLMSIAGEPFAAKDYPAVRMDDIAGRAQMAKPNLYANFRNKVDRDRLCITAEGAVVHHHALGLVTSNGEDSNSQAAEWVWRFLDGTQTCPIRFRLLFHTTRYCRRRSRRAVLVAEASTITSMTLRETELGLHIFGALVAGFAVSVVRGPWNI